MFILQHRLPYQLSFNWVTPMVIVAGLLSTICFLYGKRILSLQKFLKVLFRFWFFTICGSSDFLGWKLLLIHPQYNDLLNGFTYNVMHILLCTFKYCRLRFYQLFSTKSINEPIIAPLFYGSLSTLS
jgi:hypothetical protein